MIVKYLKTCSNKNNQKEISVIPTVKFQDELNRILCFDIENVLFLGNKYFDLKIFLKY